MHPLLAVLVVLTQPQQPYCLPQAPMNIEVAAPAGKGLACGDGKRGGLRCTQEVGGGGCGVASAPSPPVCMEAGEPCDGTDLGGHSCEGEGFAGGTLTCSSECALDLSACHPCRASATVTCAALPAAELLTPGVGKGLVTWREGNTLRGALVTPAGARVLTEPLGEQVTAWAAHWNARGWTVWLVAGGGLLERRLSESGRAGAARRLGEVRAVELLVLSDARGQPSLVVLQGTDVRPKVLPIVRGEAQPERALEEPLLGEAGTRSMVVLPILGAADGEGDLAVVGMDPTASRTSYQLYKEACGFGSSSGEGATHLDVTFKTGRLEQRTVGAAFVTTWTPKEGAPVVRERPLDARDEGLFAKHTTVGAVRLTRGADADLAAVLFSPPGAQARTWVALRRR